MMDIGIHIVEIISNRLNDCSMDSKFESFLLSHAFVVEKPVNGVIFIFCITDQMISSSGDGHRRRSDSRTRVKVLETSAYADARKREEIVHYTTEFYDVFQVYVLIEQHPHANRQRL